MKSKYKEIDWKNATATIIVDPRKKEQYHKEFMQKITCYYHTRIFYLKELLGEPMRLYRRGKNRCLHCGAFNGKNKTK